jgi:hypothetical protein
LKTTAPECMNENSEVPAGSWYRTGMQP